MKHRTSSRLALALALPALLATGCVKASKPSTATVSSLQPPGVVTIEQAIAALGNGAKSRMIVRAAPLADAGLLSLAMDSIPRDARAKYDEFASSTGFDAAKRFTGAVLYTDGDLTDIDNADKTVVFGFDGAISERFVDALDAMDDDDDDGDDDDGPERLTMVLLVDLPASTRERTRSLMADVDDRTLVLDEATDDAVLVIVTQDRALLYAYMWSGGLIFSEIPAPADAPVDAVKQELEPLLTELAVAARATGQPGTEVIAGRGSAKGVSAEFTVSVSERTVFETTFTPRREDMADIDRMLGAVPILRSQPALALGDVPPFAHQVVRLLLEDLSASRNGDQVSIRTTARTTALRSALRPVVDAIAGM